MQVKIWNRSMNTAKANCRSNSPSRPYREPLFHAFHADKIPRRSNTRASGLCTNMLSTSDHMILKFIYFIIAIFILIYHFLTTWTAINIIAKILFHQIFVSTKRVLVSQSVWAPRWRRHIAKTEHSNSTSRSVSWKRVRSEFDFLQLIPSPMPNHELILKDLHSYDVSRKFYTPPCPH